MREASRVDKVKRVNPAGQQQRDVKVRGQKQQTPLSAFGGDKDRQIEENDAQQGDPDDGYAPTQKFKPGTYSAKP